MKPESKFGVGASYGENRLQSTDEEGGADNLVKRRAIVGQLTYKWSKSLRWVAEYGHIETFANDVKDSKSDQGSVGMMLFF